MWEGLRADSLLTLDQMPTVGALFFSYLYPHLTHKTSFHIATNSHTARMTFDQITR